MTPSHEIETQRATAHRPERGRFLYAVAMRGRRRAKVEAWTRAHRLATASIGLAIISVLVAVSGLVWKSQSTSNTYDVACLQFCGGQPATSQFSLPPPEKRNADCTYDRNDKSVLGGWGPARNLLPKETFSEFPSFNLDNVGEVIGDERGLYGGREDTPPPNIWHYEIPVERGKTYILRIYIHNSAAATPDNMAALGTRVFGQSTNLHWASNC
jgi:hypothetical protein